MKKIVSCFAIVSSLALASAQAGPEACHDQMPASMEEMMFKSMDADGSGAVSNAEFKAFHAKRFKELDANKDGKITPDEMQSGRRAPPEVGRSSGTTHLDERFKAADANHDAGLDRDEAQGMPMLSMYFDEVDANKDGKVTRQEYFDAMPLLHRAKQEKADSL